jgi:uncharacterized protein YcbX
VASANVTATGFLLDRIFCIVDSRNTYLTQRESRVLAKISTSLSEDESLLMLTAPAETGLGSITLQVLLSKYVGNETVDVHDRYKGALYGYDQKSKRAETVDAYFTGETSSAWITKFIHYYAQTLPRNAVQHKQAELLLVQTFKIARIDNSKTQRRVKNQIMGDVDTVNDSDTVAFADWGAFLITTVESLTDLNKRLGEENAVGMDRFRPNIVLAGVPQPFAEEGWGAIEFGENVSLRRLIDCPRCIITTIDQMTGDRHPKQEPRKSMLKLANEGFLGKTEGPAAGPNFGVYAGIDEGGVSLGGTISVGQVAVSIAHSPRASL